MALLSGSQLLRGLPSQVWALAPGVTNSCPCAASTSLFLVATQYRLEPCRGTPFNLYKKVESESQNGNPSLEPMPEPKVPYEWPLRPGYSMRLTVFFPVFCIIVASGFASTGAVFAQSPCLEAINAELALERSELQTILVRHHGGARVDASHYGLPANDFDDATNLTIRQRQNFRRLYPGLDYPQSGPMQYPRWAYSLMNRLDQDEAAACGYSQTLTEPGSLALDSLAQLVVNANINVSNDNIPESETYLAIDPTNPQYMVGASNINLNGAGQMMYVSADYGATWSDQELVPTRTNQSDPGVNYDSNGNVYTLTLDYTGNRTAVKLYRSTDHGSSWPLQIIVDESAGNDKNLAAIDYQRTSGCRDQIYVGWDNGKAQLVAATTYPDSGVFAPKITVQSKGATIAGDLAVGPPAPGGARAPVYYVWTSTSAKTINFSKSANCGGSWTTFKTIATTKDAYDYGIPAQCNRRVLIYPTIDVDRSNSAHRGSIYVVWNDFTTAQSSGCISATDPNNANIWFIRSTDGGNTWSSPIRVNANLARTDHFNQWMNVDDTDGTIHISWRDTRNDPNRQKTDIYYTKSTDGGGSFIPEVRVTSAMSDETTAGASLDQYGDYEGLAVRNGNAYPFWTDRRVPAPEDIDTSKISP
jgi:hypothetical protein